jgi:hypothetical protein
MGMGMGMGMGMEYYLNKIVYSCFFIIKRIFLFIVYYRIDCKEMDEDEVYINYIKLNLNYYKLYLQ